MGAVLIHVSSQTEAGGADQVSKDAYMQKSCQSQTVLSKYPTFRNTNDSSL